MKRHKRAFQINTEQKLIPLCNHFFTRYALLILYRIFIKSQLKCQPQKCILFKVYRTFFKSPYKYKWVFKLIIHLKEIRFKNWNNLKLNTFFKQNMFKKCNLFFVFEIINYQYDPEKLFLNCLTTSFITFVANFLE